MRKEICVVKTEEEKAKRGSYCCLQLPNGRLQKRWTRLFLKVHSLRMRDSGHKQQYRKIQLDVTNFFCTMKVAEYQNRLLKQFVVSPSLGILKI